VLAACARSIDRRREWKVRTMRTTRSLTTIRHRMSFKRATMMRSRGRLHARHHVKFSVQTLKYFPWTPPPRHCFAPLLGTSDYASGRQQHRVAQPEGPAGCHPIHQGPICSESMCLEQRRSLFVISLVLCIQHYGEMGFSCIVFSRVCGSLLTS
jgi:hypothetical protein